MTILLGTVALEPNRWGALDVSGSATIRLSAWLPAIAAAGFDGIEVWDRHLTAAEPDEVDAVLRHPLAIEVLNSYVSLDDDDTAPRRAVAAWAARAQSHGIKFNVGPHVDEQARYGQRIAAWLEDLPASVTLLCECHAGSSIAADPAVAAAVLAAAGSPDRVQAIVHTHEAPDQLRRRFDAYGERIGHVHVNFLDLVGRSAPPLDAVRYELERKVTLLRSLGFNGSWTIEFVHGLLTDDDHPGALVAQAAEDLTVLREVLA